MDNRISMYFAVSKECNLRCSYCYLSEDNKNVKTSDSSNIKAVREFLAKCREEDISIHNVGLHGAEPTMLAPESIAEIAGMFIDVISGKVTLQSNGVNLTRDYFDRMLSTEPRIRDSMNIGFSLDGHEEIHNKYRGKTHDIVVSNMLISKQLGFHTQFLSVITNDTVQQLDKFTEQVQSLVNAGISYEFKIVEHDHSMTLENRMEFSKWTRDNEFTAGLQPLKKNICINMGNDCSFMEFDTDGSTYSCNKVFDDQFSFANWKTEKLQDILVKRKSVYKNEPISSACDSCEYSELCNGGCPISRVDGLPEDCVIRKDIYRHGFKPELNNKSLIGSTGCGCGGCGGSGDSSADGDGSSGTGGSAGGGGGTDSNGNSDTGGLGGTPGGGLVGGTGPNAAPSATAAENQGFEDTVGRGMVTSNDGWATQEGTVSHAQSMFGFGYDTHTNMATMAGFTAAAEAVADIVEAFGGTIGSGPADTMSAETAQAIGSVAMAAAGYATGVRGIQAAAAVATAVVDTAVATGHMDAEVAAQAKAAIAVVSIVTSLPGQVAGINAAMNARGMPAAARAMIGMKVAAGLYGLSSLGQAAAAAGLTGGLTNAGGLSYGGTMAFGLFANSLGINPADSLAVLGAYQAFTSLSAKSIDVNSVQNDPFEWMAGGAKYEAQFAGGIAYQPNKVRDSKNIAAHSFGISKEDRVQLFQEDGRYTNLEPIDTSINTTQSSVAPKQLMQKRLSRLIEDYNESVESAEYVDTTAKSERTATAVGSWSGQGERDKMSSEIKELLAKLSK